LSRYLGDDDPGPGTRHQLDLPPLTEADTAALLQEMLGDPGGAAFTAAVLRTAAGRPAVLRDIVARWTSDGRSPEPEQVPHLMRIGRAVTSARAARVRRGLPPDALALLRAMSVSALDVVLAGRLAGLPETAVAGALEPLVASGLVAAGRPAEPHLAAEVLAELADKERADLHLRAAELAHRGGAGAAVAAELLRTAPPAGEPWARAVLGEAAEQWLLQGNPTAAAEALRRALAEPAAPRDRAALLIRLASVTVRQDPDRADRELLRVLTEPELSGLRAALTAADLVLARGDVETIRRVVAELGSPGVGSPGGSEAEFAGVAAVGFPGVAAVGSPATREAEVPSATAADSPATPEPRFPGAASVGSPAAPPAPANGTQTRPPHRASTVDPAMTALGRIAAEEAAIDPVAPLATLPPAGPGLLEAAEAGAEAFRLATRGEDRRQVLDLAERALIVREDAPLVPRIAACRALLCCHSLDSAAEGLTAVAAAARRRDAHAAASQALLQRAAVALRRNRPDDALRDLAAAERELPVRCWHPAAVPAYLAVEIGTHLRLGRLEHARHLAGEPLPRGGEHPVAQAFLLHARAELALAGDDPGAALAMARECGRVLRSRGWVNPMLAPWRATAGLALRRLGDSEAAMALLAEELALAERWGTGEALESLREHAAADLRRAVPAPRRPADPVAGPPAGQRFAPHRPDALSPAERDVAGLAARGLPNREIARELSIALRTVELRLTKVYRKLGLKGRAALTDHWPTRTPGG
jgi:DNA-binding CsgD family transcriptional regulator